MKKLLLLIFIPFIVIFTSCNSTKTPNQNNPSSKEVKNYKISDYYPFKENTKMSYLGKGNEYASQDILFDFIKGDIAQVRIINPGTTSIKVLQNKNGELSLITSRGEFYHKDDMTALANNTAEREIILKEPLITGTTWEVSKGIRRSITNTSSKISTPYGDFNVLEVTTEGADYKIKDYYSMNIGLVKSIFTSNNSEVSSSLEKIDTNAFLTENIKLFFPRIMTNDIKQVFTNINANLRTNEEIKDTFEKYFKTPPKENLSPLISKNTKLNKLYLNSSEKKVYADFSKELVEEMNTGSSMELSIINSITNSLGTYYNTDTVYITVNNAPYSSGHIALDKDEAFTVDFSGVEEAK